MPRQRAADFERLTDSTKNDKVKVILVSLDMKSSWNTNLVSFLKKQNFDSHVAILYETDANAWIEQVDSTWEGSIPATLIYNKEKRYFHEGQMDYNELKTQLK